MKLYLRPKGENGLPLHPTANVEECMKSYDKIVGELYTEEEVTELLKKFAPHIRYNHKELPHTWSQVVQEWFDEHKKQTK